MSRLSRARYLFLPPLFFPLFLSLFLSAVLVYLLPQIKINTRARDPARFIAKTCPDNANAKARQCQPGGRMQQQQEVGAGRGYAVFVKPEKTKCRRHNNSWTADGHINILNMFIQPYFVAPQNLQCLPPTPLTPCATQHAEFLHMPDHVRYQCPISYDSFFLSPSLTLSLHPPLKRWIYLPALFLFLLLHSIICLFYLLWFTFAAEQEASATIFLLFSFHSLFFPLSSLFSGCSLSMHFICSCHVNNKLKLWAQSEYSYEYSYEWAISLVNYKRLQFSLCVSLCLCLCVGVYNCVVMSVQC